ncbi:hypothetical protein J2S09_004108 [Bacillus fengqiuensis]|nr:hypothetical protein [Bacillus fengqiuensis]
MIDGFQKAAHELIEKRLEELLTSEEYQRYSDTTYKYLEEKLSIGTEPLGEDTRTMLIDDIKTNIFESVFFQSKLAYKQGFTDALIFLIKTLVVPR